MYAAIDISRISFFGSAYSIVALNIINFTFIQESRGSCVERTIHGVILHHLRIMYHRLSFIGKFLFNVIKIKTC
jgi:hypothetical protein